MVVMGVGVSGGASKTTSKKATLQIVALGSSKVTSQPAGIVCGGGSKQCSARYPVGTTVTLSVVVSPLEVFVGWNWPTCPTVKAVGTTVSCTVRVAGDMTIASKVCGVGGVDTSHIVRGCPDRFLYGWLDFDPYGPTPELPLTKIVTTVVVKHTGGGSVKVSPYGSHVKPCAGASTCYRFNLQGTFIVDAQPRRGWVLSAWRPGCDGRSLSCTRSVYDYPTVVAVFHRR